MPEAPLSDVSITIVLSSCPESSRYWKSRPRLRVGVVEECSERLEEPRREAPGVVGEVVPAFDARVAVGQLRVGRDDAAGQLTFVPFCAHFVPAGVEAAAVLLDVLAGGLVRFVDGAEGEIGEEGLVGPVRLLVADELDCVVDQILSDVIALFRAFGRSDVTVVLGQFGIELVGRAGKEAVVAVESALQRPMVVGACGAVLLGRAEMPFADHVGRVTARPQHFGQGGRVL